MKVGRSLRGKKLSLRPGAVILGALLLVGIGVFAGVVLGGNAGTPSTSGTAGAAGAAGAVNATGGAAPSPARAIDMTRATAAACRPPVKPGPGHADTLLSQVFNVRDTQQTAYLLGWQIVPYKGARTYTFGKGGNLLALEPPTGGPPLGFGSGTVTFSGNADAGTVHALVRLSAGGTLTVTGNWVCSASGK